jgi:hypothetical protein
VEECDAATFLIVETENTHSLMESEDKTARYCRPFASENIDRVTGEPRAGRLIEYWSDGYSTEKAELGTKEFPFKNLAASGKEVFNYAHEENLDCTTYFKRGSHFKLYYGIAPVIALNLGIMSLKSYGDLEEPKPYVWITDHDYIWHTSTAFSLEEETYLKDERVALGHWDASEASKYFLKFAHFRASVYFESIDFQSIMFGDAWLNPLVFTFGTNNNTYIMKDSSIDVDGAMGECYTRIAVELNQCKINITNAEYGLWNDLRDGCEDGENDFMVGYIKVIDSHYFGSWDESLFSWFYLSTWDDAIIEGTTWERTGYMDMETRPFSDIHAAANCDPTTRS